MKPASFQKIGKYFQEGRKKKGLSQNTVSDYLGYRSKQLVSNWERGVCAPPMKELGSLIVLLGLERKTVIHLFIEARRYELFDALRSKK